MITPTTRSISEQFQQTYGHAPAVIARAPGRVEFIGNHTDYNGGAVLGAAIDRYVWVAASANPTGPSTPLGTGRLRLFSASGSTVLELPADPGTRITGSDSWANYPLGVWRSLRDFNLPQPAGFDLLVVSDLPSGAGLSSSAALELSTALALLALTGATIEPGRLAALGRHAENKYVGVPCGILDQGTSAHGQAGHLVHIDCRGPAFSVVPFPPSAHLWIFNTREKHALIDGLYATRHQECLDAAWALGVALLADLTPAQLAEKNGSSGGLALPAGRSPALQGSAGHGVQALELEVGSGGEQVAVVGVDGLEAVRGGGGEVQGVGTAEVNRAGQSRIDRADALQHLRAGREPVKGAGLAVGGELIKPCLISLRCDHALAEFAMEG